MSDTTIFTVYAVASGCWLLLLILMILLLRRGLRAFFSELSDNADTVSLLSRMALLALLLIGAAGVLGHRYTTGGDANWLTVTWNVTDQFQEAALGIVTVMVIFVLAFLLVYVIGKRLGVVGR